MQQARARCESMLRNYNRLTLPIKPRDCYRFGIDCSFTGSKDENSCMNSHIKRSRTCCRDPSLLFWAMMEISLLLGGVFSPNDICRYIGHGMQELSRKQTEQVHVRKNSNPWSARTVMHASSTTSCSTWGRCRSLMAVIIHDFAVF